MKSDPGLFIPLRYKTHPMQKMFSAMLQLAYNPKSELYYNGKQHRGAQHRCAFWDAFNGTPSLYAKERGTLAAACWAAGKEWAKQCKTTSRRAA